MAEGVKIADHAIKVNGLWYRAGDVLPSDDQEKPVPEKEPARQEEPVKPAPRRRKAGRK